jgi:hypothetical protein
MVHCGHDTAWLDGGGDDREEREMWGRLPWPGRLTVEPHKEGVGQPTGPRGEKKETRRAGPPGGFQPKRLESKRNLFSDFVFK